MRTEFWQESFLKGASWILNKKQNVNTFLGLREIDCENWRWMQLDECLATM